MKLNSIFKDHVKCILMALYVMLNGLQIRGGTSSRLHSAGNTLKKQANIRECICVLRGGYV